MSPTSSGVVAELEQVHGQQQGHVAIAEGAQPLGREEAPDGMRAHFVPKLKASKEVTLSALVHTPTAPAPGDVRVVELDARRRRRRITRMRVALNSTRSVCQASRATGASTYLMVLREPPSV
jgi:hypothetical protein